MSLRAVLVDDERLARAEFRRLLAAHPEIEIVGEAADAPEARALLTELEASGARPDVLFLDVQMPGETGFDLLASLESVPRSVVFVTAYDEHALRAFEVSAQDYLVKPVAPARLAAALARLPPEADDEPAESDAEPPEASGDRPLGADDRVFVKDGDHLHFIRLGDVRLFESEGNYVRLYVGDEAPLVLRSLNQLEERLDPALFFRANRKHLLNLAHVNGLEDWFGGALRATLGGGEAVELSRRQAQRFRERTSL